MSKILTLPNFKGKIETKKQEQPKNKTITLKAGNSFWVLELATKKMWAVDLVFNLTQYGGGVCSFTPKKGQIMCMASSEEQANDEFLKLLTKIKENEKKTK